MPFNDTTEGKTYSCPHICHECLGIPEYNHSQLYILINALENLRIPADEQEYEFIRNNLLSRFREKMKEHKAKYEQ